MKTAIMVDGGFYLRRAGFDYHQVPPKEAARGLHRYCLALLGHDPARDLYRIFYYDCPPLQETVFNPLRQENVSLGQTPRFAWMKRFHKALTSQRKMALRMGELLKTQEGYRLNPGVLKDLLSGKRRVEDLTEADLRLDVTQKGVDMKLGIDIASLSYGRYVDQIILIAGDSDFVPAAKLARRHGIDFILDPMWSGISDSLREHIDGIETACPRPAGPHPNQPRISAQ